MLWVTLSILIVVTLFAAVSDSRAHLITRPSGKTLKARETSQMKNLYHALYVCHKGARQHKRWSCRATVWLRRELLETRAAQHRLEQRRLARMSPIAAIRHVFGPYADQALAVARCESGLSTRAQNGQYLGLFQMGDWARSRYGHGWTALEQARAAYRYFRESGWSGWQCRPGGLAW